MMRFLKELGTPAPKALSAAAEIVLNAGLRRAFEDEEFDPKSIEDLLEEAMGEGITLDSTVLEYAFRKNLERMAELFRTNPSDLLLLKNIESAVNLVSALPFQVNLWKIQNDYHEVLQGVYAEFKGKAEHNDKEAREWLEHFKKFGEKLYVLVE
jgi:hypothetical protein